MKIGEYFNTEYRRASIATLIINCVRFVMMYFKIDSISYMLSGNAFLHLSHYVLDVFISKEFDDPKFVHKLNWFVKSFQNFIFTKYVIVIFLHTLISSTVYTYVKSKIHKIKKHKLIDLLTWFIINILTNGLYLHFIKFEWAYQEVTDPIFSLIIVSWCSLSFMMFMNNNKNTVT